MSDALPDEVENTLVSTSRPNRADPKTVVARLRELGWSIGVAESLTGGLVVSALVEVAGASAVVRGGVVAYASEVKQRVLGVDPTLLAAHGAVHPRVARQMAEGARRVFAAGAVPADVGVATTGIAGPDSPDGQPVGTVHLAISTALGSRVETLALAGTRAEIRSQAASAALRLILAVL